MDGKGADGRTAGDWNSCPVHLPGSGWWNDGGLARDSSGARYLKRSSLKTVVLKMHKALILGNKLIVFACVMFKNKAKSLQIKDLTSVSACLCSTMRTQWLKISLCFVRYLHDFAEVLSFALCTQVF